MQAPRKPAAASRIRMSRTSAAIGRLRISDKAQGNPRTGAICCNRKLGLVLVFFETSDDRPGATVASQHPMEAGFIEKDEILRRGDTALERFLASVQPCE